MILALAISLVFSMGLLVFLANYIIKNMEERPSASLIVACVMVPVLLVTAYLTNSLINAYKEDKTCDSLGGEIVNEVCIDIRQAPVIVLPPATK